MARYRPSDPRDLLAAYDFLNRAKEQQFDIELKKYYPKRSNKQNGFLHFLCAYFAHQYGCTAYEAKQVFLKEYACPLTFKVEKEIRGEKVTYFRSTADLNTAEMASVIKNFIAWSNYHGIMLPEPTDDIAIRCAEREMESSTGWT